MIGKKIKDTLVLNRDMAPVSMLPPTTVNWETAVKMIYNGSASVVHEYSDWIVRSPSVTMNVPSVIMVSQYVGNAHAVPLKANYIFLRDDYRCQYCHQIFDSNILTRDHVTPRKFGGKNSWENLTTACGPCNQSRGHDVSIMPKNLPHRPTYWELIKKIKNYQIVVPDESWVPYLGWSETILIRGKKILNNSISV